MTSEKADLNQTLMRLSALPETMCYRQNTGTAWQGKELRLAIGDTIRVTPGMKILVDARPIDFGLPGAGDIVGITRGVGWQVEQKTTTGHHADQQRLFGMAWTRAGGIYVVARSPDAAVREINAIG